MIRYLPFLVILAVWIYAFIDCLNTPENEVRKLPKAAWVLIVLLFGEVLLGPIAWFAVGRPRHNSPYGATRPQERRWVAPDDNPEFLKSLKQDPPGATPSSPSSPSSASSPSSSAAPRDEKPAAEPEYPEDTGGRDRKRDDGSEAAEADAPRPKDNGGGSGPDDPPAAR